MKGIKFMLTFFSVLFFASIISAQPVGKMDKRIEKRIASIDKKLTSIDKSLALTEAQKAKIKTTLRASRTKLKALPKNEENKKTRRKIRLFTKDEINKTILTSKQHEALKKLKKENRAKHKRKQEARKERKPKRTEG